MNRLEVNDERIVVLAPAGAELAIQMAAIRARLPPAQFVRRLLLDGLRANGYDLADPRLGSTHA